MRWLVEFALKRGIPAWVVPLICYGLLAGACAALFCYVHHLGELDERERWVKKENAELVKRQTKILELTTLNRELERASNLRALSLQTVYEGMLQDEKTRANSLITSATLGGKRLSIPTRQTVPACAAGVGSATASLTTVTSETRAELSEEAAQFLIAIGREADQAVIESNAVKNELMDCRAHVAGLVKSHSAP